MKIRLGDLTKIKTGKLDANASSPDGDYPFFTCSREPLRINTYSYDCECVLVAGNGDLNVKYYNGKFDAYQRTYIIEGNGDRRIYIPYLYYFLDGYVEELRRLSIGGVIKYIKLGNLTEAMIELPSIERQKHIVRILEKAKKIADDTRTELCALDTLIKARFVEMFGDVEQEDTLLNLCNIIDYRGKTPEKVEDGLPFITAKNVRMHQLSIEPREYISKEVYDSVMTRGFPREGDVVFTTEAPLGNVCRLPHFDTEFYVGQRIVTLQTEKLAPAYLEYALDTDEFRRKVEGKSSGSTVTGIRVRLLEQLTIPVPNRASQEQFAAFVSQVDKSKVVVQKALDEAQLLFDSLMQKYFG